MTHLDPGPFVLFAFATIDDEPTDATVRALEPPAELPEAVRERLARLVYFYKLFTADEDRCALDAIMHELARITLAPNYHSSVMNALSRTVMARHARHEASRRMLAPIERVAAGI